LYILAWVFISGRTGAGQINQEKVDFMTLHEVSSAEEFEEYYRSNNIQTTDAKISYLKKAMKVRAMLYDEDETPEEVLAGLEESALLGFWKASW
jgi:hypothetical protein